MRTREDLERLDKKARDILSTYSINVEKVYIEINSRYRRAYGTTYFVYNNGKKYAYKIGLMKDFFECEKVSEHDILEVLIHEYLHVAFPYDCHKGNWLKYAKQITQTSDFKITRTSHYEGVKDNYKYIVYCPVCGYQWKFKSRNNYVKNASRYIHESCGKDAHLVSYKL